MGKGPARPRCVRLSGQTLGALGVARALQRLGTSYLPLSEHNPGPTKVFCRDGIHQGISLHTAISVCSSGGNRSTSRIFAHAEMGGDLSKETDDVLAAKDSARLLSAIDEESDPRVKVRRLKREVASECAATGRALWSHSISDHRLVHTPRAGLRDNRVRALRLAREASARGDEDAAHDFESEAARAEAVEQQVQTALAEVQAGALREKSRPKTMRGSEGAERPAPAEPPSEPWSSWSTFWRDVLGPDSLPSLCCAQERRPAITNS